LVFSDFSSTFTLLSAVVKNRVCNTKIKNGSVQGGAGVHQAQARAHLEAARRVPEAELQSLPPCQRRGRHRGKWHANPRLGYVIMLVKIPLILYAHFSSMPD